MSLPARLIGILMSPRATYADVVARPRVLGALAVVILISSVAVYTFMSTEVGKQAGWTCRSGRWSRSGGR